MMLAIQSQLEILLGGDFLVGVVDELEGEVSDDPEKGGTAGVAFVVDCVD